MREASLLGGKVALVTGASSTLGAAVVASFIGHGALVAAADESEEVAQRSLKDASATGDSQAYQLDVSSPAEIQAVVDAVNVDLGPLEILVCCAEMVPMAPVALHQSELPDWQRVFDVNLRGSFMCCRAALPGFLARGKGTVVLSASTASFRPEVDAAYDSSKAALLALNRTVGLQYAAEGVRCNAVASPPFMIGSGVLSPETVAATYVFLASDESSYVTGSVYVVDGGAMTFSGKGVAHG